MKVHLNTFAILTFVLVLLLSLVACDDKDAAIDGDVDVAEIDLDFEADIELDEVSELEPEAEPETELELEIEAEIEPEKEIPDPGFDKYYGSLRHTTNATGFFRVEQINEQWWLITPDGHPFFSTGINVLGPYGTRGEDGQRYYDAIMEKYGSKEEWADAQVPRILNWGWNTAGGWSHWSLFKDRLPFTTFVYLSESNWTGTGPLDFFSESYHQNVLDKVAKATEGLVDNPWLIGYFLDNEMHWGNDLWRGIHLFDEYMMMDIATSAGKAELISYLQDTYLTIEALKADFITEATDWDALALLVELESKDTDAALACKAGWTGVVAEEYFSTGSEALKAADPNHMNLGCRFISQYVPSAAIEVAGQYVDVMTINFYDMLDGLNDFLQSQDPDYLSVDNFLKEHYIAGKKPIMVTEWGFRARDAGEGYNSYPPIYPTLDTQEDRADAYENKFREMLDRPWFVGQHWFLFADQPVEGRVNPPDGEDNNFGLVSEYDVPYQPLVERSQMMYGEIYRRLAWPAISDSK